MERGWLHAETVNWGVVFSETACFTFSRLQMQGTSPSHPFKFPSQPPQHSDCLLFFFPCAAFCSVRARLPQLLSKLCQCAQGKTPPGWWMCHAHPVGVTLLTRLTARQGFLSFKFEYLHRWLLIFDPFDTVFC